MKRILIALLILGLAGSAAFTGEKKKINANIASMYAAEGNIHEGFMKFKELIEAKTDGRIQITVHPAGALGGERDILESLVTGNVEMGASGGLMVTLYAPEYGVTEEDFVFMNQKQIDNFRSSPAGKALMKKLEDEKGLIAVGMVPRGARWITANKPIKTIDDMKGVKIRTPDTPNRIAYFKSIGAIPSIVAFPELYMALKTGVVDAQENPLETIYNYRFYETQKYLMPSRHHYTMNHYLISKRWFSRVDPEDRKLIIETWKEATDFANAMTPDPDAYYLEKLVKEKGMIVVPEFDRPAFVKAAEALFPNVAKNLLPGLLDEVRALPSE